VLPGLMELTPCTGCASKRGAAARRPSLSNWPEAGPARNASAGMTMSPMSSTAGGGGGGGGGMGFAGFFAVVAAGFDLAFELPAAGFLVVVAGLAGVDVCASETGASRHTATKVAARFKARGSRASMGADSTHAPARTHDLVEICDVHHPEAVEQPAIGREYQTYRSAIAPDALGAITRKSSNSTSLQR